MRLRWLPPVVAMPVFFLHYVCAFMSWSLQAGPAAAQHSGDTLARLWPVLSFPLFTVLPASFINANWALTMLANSGVWAIVAFVALSLAIERVFRPRPSTTP